MTPHVISRSWGEQHACCGTGKAKVSSPGEEARDVVERLPFLSLAMDLPPAPLYKDVMEKNIIPQARASTVPVKQPVSVFVGHLAGFIDDSAWWRILRWHPTNVGACIACRCRSSRS